MKRSLLPKAFFDRPKDSHKGTFGHVFVVGGSPGMSGAPALAAKAALRSGAGLVTAWVPESVAAVTASFAPEVMAVPVPATTQGHWGLASIKPIVKRLDAADVLVVGPGLSRQSSALSAVRSLVRHWNGPVVIDADALLAFASTYEKLLKVRPAPTIVTPHPGEFAAWQGTTIAKVQKHRKAFAQQSAKTLGCIVVLKGHRTVIASSEKTVINANGNPGMATAGMGDVLSGVIGALLAQKIPAFLAAQSGVYLHASAGDLAAKQFGQVSMIASDVIDALPTAFGKASSVRRPARS